jgi:DnaJ-class molecular chaperone
MKRIFNNSKQQMEIATQETCPRCKGFGSNRGDEDNCPLCDGHGYLWLAKSGFTLKLYGRQGQEKLY